MGGGLIKSKTKEFITQKIKYYSYYDNSIFIKDCFVEEEYSTPLLSFLFTLRSNPEYISLILNNCKNVEFYQPLSYFVVDSIFTDCFLEKESYEEISFIMDKTLEKEINSIPSIDNIDMFLSNNSINFFLIKALMIKNDIQNYMCLILKDLIQEVSTYSNLILTLDLQYINSLSLIPESYLSQNSTDLKRFYDNFIIPFTKKNDNKRKRKMQNRKNEEIL